MQDYLDFAKKNGVELRDSGSCQFCGASTQRGVHECVEIFNLGFPCLDYTKPENHLFRFVCVDAHTLQHSEIHGRWNNHFHLTRQHLIFNYACNWSYKLSPKLSDHLNGYKKDNAEEFLKPPPLLERGKIRTTDVLLHTQTEEETKRWILKWGKEVYAAWCAYHSLVDDIAKGFLSKYEGEIHFIE
jgi:hypothetical protein